MKRLNVDESRTDAYSKLLEPTYDDDGRLIPLSERFNKQSSDVRYRVKGLDIFSKREYDNYGWAVNSGALSYKELNRFTSLHGELPIHAKTNDGYFVYATGNKEGIDNTLIVGNKSFTNPVIKRVYSINSENENFNETVRDKIYEWEKVFGAESLKIARETFIDGSVCGYSLDGAETYEEYENERRMRGNGGKDFTSDTRLQYGGRSAEGDEVVSTVTDAEYAIGKRHSTVQKAILDVFKAQLDETIERGDTKGYKALAGSLQALLSGAAH